MIPSHTKPKQGLRIIFAGTPDFAAHHLQVLLNSGHDIIAVYTQPDRPAGRGKKLTPSAVKKLALAHQLPIEQPMSLKQTPAQDVLRAYQADVMVVVAYGLLLPQAVLDTPSFGCVNVHGSLLPRWRGAAPIQRAIQSGDQQTGITIMKMDKGLDTGDMLLKVACPINHSETSASLHDKLMHLGGPALLEVLTQIQQHTLSPEKQDDGQACYAEKITKQEAQINWQEPAAMVVKKIQAFNPFPIAYSFFKQQRIKIYTASIMDNPVNHSPVPGTLLHVDGNGIIVACGAQSALCIHTLQIPNKKVMPVSALLNGNAQYFAVGEGFDAQAATVQ